MFIRPATIPEGMEGAGASFRVRDPVTHQFLAAEGEHKPDTDYWLRRLMDGGVEEVDAPVETAQTAVVDKVEEPLLIEHEGSAP